MRFHRIIYYKYPATWAKIHLNKCERLFYFMFKPNFKYGQWFAQIQTPIFHFQKDNCNLILGPSFLWWQFSLHFHW
jgi:hypothetical protein